MPTYNFTSDLRIASLPERLKSAANEIMSNELSLDKSASNNRATLAFYFNLVEGSNTLKLAANGSVTEVVRNFVLKFQFPNTYTADLFNKNKEEGLLVAPLRECVKLLAHQYLVNKETQPYLTYDEIRYYIFATPYRWIGASSHTYSDIIQEILTNRQNSTDYTSLIESELSWKQYERQSREMISIIPYACDAFITKKGMLILEMPSPLSDNFADCLHFLASVLKGDTYWDCSNHEYNTLTKQSYTEYMDINGEVELCRQSMPCQLTGDFNTVDQPLQLIYYGAPGTGKSFTIDKATNENNSVRTTFHPDSDYASFVGAYKPTMAPMPVHAFVGTTVHHAKNAENEKAYEKKIVYKYVPQAFLKAYVEAWKRYAAGEDNPYYLVIEEINRGNCAQIFGDLFQLLDRNNMGCSSYAISADEDIAQFLREDDKGFGKLTEEQKNAIGEFKLKKDSGVEENIGYEILNGSKLLLPPNLRIWATMNTSDQSLFPIDSAFKRRWNWEYMPIEYDPTDKNTNERLAWKLEVRGKMYYWGQFLDYINPKILKLTMSEDKQMGYFFAKPDKRGTDGRLDIISEKVFVNKVLFYLWTDVFKDYDLTEDPFVYENEGSKTRIAYRFTDFFPVENNDMLTKFVEGFKLPVVGEQSEDNTANTEEATKRTYGRSLVVKFPDGTQIKGDTQFDSYMQTLQKIGLDKAAEVIAKKGYSRNQAPLISKEKYEAIESSPTFSYVQSGDYYIIKGIDSMEGTLKGISKELGLGLEVYFE